uniref:Uncharacterized protein n=1 Tax=Chromera velia CCMP2878 TaxID=1169474 RepID=A0A0G4G6Z8_9ALVE
MFSSFLSSASAFRRLFPGFLLFCPVLLFFLSSSHRGVSSRSDASPTTGASEKLQEAETRVTELQQEIGGLTTKVTDAKTERDAAEKESFAAVAKSASMKEAAADLMAEIADRRKQTAALLSEMKKPEKHISNEQLDEFERMAEATNRQLENDLQQKEAEVREAEARSIKSTMVASRKAKELMAAEGSLTAGQTQLQEAQREKAIAGDLLEMADQEQAEERAVQQISRLQSELAKAKANAQVEKQLQKKRATQSKGTKTEAPTKSLTQLPSLLENAKEIPTKQMATPPADPEFNAAVSRAFQEQLRSADSSLASQALMQARVQAADADLDAESPNLKETADPRKTLLEEEWAPYVPNTPPPVPTAMAEENDATGIGMPPTAGGGEDFDEFSSAFLEMRQTQRSVPRTPDQIQAAIEQQRQVIAQARQAEQEAAARMMQESAQIDSTIEASLTARETEAKKKVYRDSPDAPDGLHTAKVVMRQIRLSLACRLLTFLVVLGGAPRQTLTSLMEDEGRKRAVEQLVTPEPLIGKLWHRHRGKRDFSAIEEVPVSFLDKRQGDRQLDRQKKKDQEQERMQREGSVSMPESRCGSLASEYRSCFLGAALEKYGEESEDIKKKCPTARDELKLKMTLLGKLGGNSEPQMSYKEYVRELNIKCERYLSDLVTLKLQTAAHATQQSPDPLNRWTQSLRVLEGRMKWCQSSRMKEPPPRRGDLPQRQQAAASSSRRPGRDSDESDRTGEQNDEDREKGCEGASGSVSDGGAMKAVKGDATWEATEKAAGKVGGEVTAEATAKVGGEVDGQKGQTTTACKSPKELFASRLKECAKALYEQDKNIKAPVGDVPIDLHLLDSFAPVLQQVFKVETHGTGIEFSCQDLAAKWQTECSSPLI